MMMYQSGRGKVNVRLLIILVVTIAVASMSLVAARRMWRGVLSEKALTAGRAAFAQQDWPAAVESLRDYLGYHPNDLAVLRQYAEALAALRPRDRSVLAGCISAYRRILRLDPRDQTISEKLATLYTAIENYEELAAVARARLEQDPNDIKAPLWLGEALSRLNKKTEARQTLEAFFGRLETLPGKHPEYVRACVLMSGLAAGDSTPAPDTVRSVPARASQETPRGVTTNTPATAEDQESVQSPTPIDWLNRAVTYAPDSAEALAYRARFHRLGAAASDANEAAKRAARALARRDLEAVDALGTDDPRLRYSLGVEWMLLGELDRATAELQAADKLPKDMPKGQFFDLSGWTVARFLLGSELALRRGAATEAATLADETLASLSEKQERAYRGRVLPSAVRVYVTAARSADAKRCLEEYLALVQDQQVRAPSPREIAGLQALVEAGENRPYGVIDLLEPTIGKDPNDPRAVLLLAQAYNQTDQTRRAVTPLEQCRRLNPQDLQVARELAREYTLIGDFEEAFEVARQAESVSPADADLRLLRLGAAISLALEPGRSPDAAHLEDLSTELAALRQQYPQRVDIRIFQAIIAATLGQSQEAERELKQAIQECQEPFLAEVQLMRQYVDAGRIDDALEVCEASCARHKDLVEPWLILSDLYVMKQDYEAARRSLQQGLTVVTGKPNQRLLSVKLALVELSRGTAADRSAGIRRLKELAADPQEIRARLLLLQCREVRADPNEAARLIGELRRAEGERGLWWRLYQASLWLAAPNAAAKQQDITNLLQYCITADPSWPAPVLLLARMWERQGDVKQAEDIYRRGLLGNPSATQIADGLLNLLVGQSRFVEAEQVLRQIQSPRAVADWRVRLAVGTGDFSRAIEELKLRVSNDKQDAASRIELARLTYRETKDAAQALRYLDEAQAIAPNSGTLVMVKASILKGEGKPAEARRVLNQYVADFNNFQAYWIRAAYLAGGDKPEQAEADYRKLTTFAENAAAGYELLAQFYAGTRRLDQAVAAVEEGLRTCPQELRLKRNLMQLLLSRDQPGDKDRAFALLAELEKQLPQDTSLMMMGAVQKMEEGTPQSLAEARATLETIVRREPTAVEAQLALIGLVVREGDHRTACDLAARALAANPGHPALLMARAREELALGYVSMAAKLAWQVLQQDPNRVDAFDVLTRVASSAVERDLLEEARRRIDAAIRRQPPEERLLLARARFYLALGRPKEALPEMEAYCRTKEGGRSVTARVTLAELYRTAGDLARADEVIRQVEQSDPDQQAVVHARFLWLASQKRWDDLKGISSAYIKAKGQDLATVLKAGAMLTAFDPPQLKQEGLKLFEHAVAQWPSSAEARLTLASTLYQRGEAPRAEKLYREVLAQHPNEVRALNDLAWILQEHDRSYESALEVANRGLKLAPENLDLLDTRGTILMNLPDRLAEARDDFTRLVRLLPDDANRRAKALLQLGRVCAQLNDLAQAKQHLQDALDLDRRRPVFTDAERAEILGIIEPTGK